MDGQPVLACPFESCVTEITKFSNLSQGWPGPVLGEHRKKGQQRWYLVCFEQPRCFCPWNEKVKEVV